MSDEHERLRELAGRLVAPGPKASHVSASETYDIHDGVFELIDRVRKLEAVNLDQARNLLDPDATCCADATRVHKEQREQIEALTTRQAELLQLVRNLSQSTPLADELAGWEGQPSALVAEVGTLKARVVERESRIRDLEWDREQLHTKNGALRAEVANREGARIAAVLGWQSLIDETEKLKARVRELEAQRDEAQAQSNRDLEARRLAQLEHALALVGQEKLREQITCLHAQRDAVETQTSIEQWRRETFGSTSTTSRLAARANLEMAELLDALSVSDTNPAAAAECADVVIVIFGVASKLGVDLLAEVDAKMRINRAQKWTVAGDGTGKHERDKSVADG